MAELATVFQSRQYCLLSSEHGVAVPAGARSGADDFDAWQAWVIDLLRQYAECAARHVKTVQAWPK